MEVAVLEYRSHFLKCPSRVYICAICSSKSDEKVEFNDRNKFKLHIAENHECLILEILDSRLNLSTNSMKILESLIHFPRGLKDPKVNKEDVK
jgi:hypothetical protein